MIKYISDILNTIDTYYAWLAGHGCEFDSNGFPVPHRDWYLTDIPDNMVTYQERNSKLVSTKNKTVLCFFSPDVRIYPRLERVLNNIGEYGNYMGVVGADVTVTADMDIEWQKETMLLNQLFMAMLALSGIKVIQNLRIGHPSTLECLSSVPKGVMCASGILGCDKTTSYLDMRYLEKVLYLRPSCVLLYGKSDPILEEQLDYVGIGYQRYTDTHSSYKQHRIRTPASQHKEG